MSYSTYRPPPPAPSAFFAMQLAQSTSVLSPIPSDAPLAPSSEVPSSLASTAAVASAAAALAAAAAASQTPSSYLPRIPSKLSVNVTTAAAQSLTLEESTVPLVQATMHMLTSSSTTSASRNNSASSITALPSLSSSLNNLHIATSLDHVEIVGTQTPEAEELLRRVIQGNVKRMSNPSMGPAPDSTPPSQRTFSHYSDDESDSEDDDENDNTMGSAYGGYFQQRPRRSLESNGASPRPMASPGVNVANASRRPPGAARANSGGLVMNRSRKDRPQRSAAAFAF